MNEYEPTHDDIIWGRSLLTMLNEGGIWQAPAAGSVYRVSHEKKTITLITTVDHEDITKIHQRSISVFAKIGYAVNKLGDE